MAANGLSSITWSFNLFLGSGLGGVVAASFLASAALLRGMRFAVPHVTGARLRVRGLADFTPIAAGIHYIARDKRLLALLFVKAGMGILGANWVLLPLYGERIFPVSLSALMSSRGVGALIGPLAAGYWTGQRHSRLRVRILVGLLLGGFGYLGLAAAPTATMALSSYLCGLAIDAAVGVATLVPGLVWIVVGLRRWAS